MEHLFFNDSASLNEVSQKIFGIISKDSMVHIRESSNVYLGKYTYIFIDGVKISIEYNSYDYEDDYKYMLCVKENFLEDKEISKQDIKKLTNSIAHTIIENINNIDLMYETIDGQLIKVTVNEDI